LTFQVAMRMVRRSYTGTPVRIAVPHAIGAGV
jgi:hypothetical protein